MPVSFMSVFVDSTGNIIKAIGVTEHSAKLLLSAFSKGGFTSRRDSEYEYTFWRGTPTPPPTTPMFDAAFEKTLARKRAERAGGT